MMMAIVDAVRSWNVTQAVAARRLAITRPRLDQLHEGRLSEFSLGALTDLAAGAGIGVTVRLQRARKPAADRSAASPPTTIRADELATMLLEHFRPASDFVA